MLKRYSSYKSEIFKSHLNANWPSCFEESSIYKTKINHSDIRSTIYHVHSNYWNTATLLSNKLYDKHINSLHECILTKAPWCTMLQCKLKYRDNVANFHKSKVICLESFRWRGLLWNWVITWNIIKNWNLKLLIPFRILMTAPCATFRIKNGRLKLKLFHCIEIHSLHKWSWTWPKRFHCKQEMKCNKRWKIASNNVRKQVP